MKRFSWIHTAAVLLAVGLLTTAQIHPAEATPPSPALYGKSADGPWKAYEELMSRDDLGPGINMPYPGKGPATTGTLYMPVILMQYPGWQAGTFDTTAFFNQLFSLQTHPTGSMLDYFLEISKFWLWVWGRPVGWYTAPQPESYYANGGGGMLDWYPMNSQGIVEQAVRAADPIVDFRNFDNDGPDHVPNSGDDDGFVDCVMIFTAGYGAENTGNLSNDIWAHCWYMDAGRGPGPINTNDVGANGQPIKVDLYTIQSELEGVGPAQIRDIGIPAHETIHALGMPDLNNTAPAQWQQTLGSWNGVGCYDVMGFGNWGAGGTTPSRPFHPSGFTKAFLGWATPIHVDVNLTACPIPCMETSDTLYCTFPFQNSGGIDFSTPLGYDPPPQGKVFPPPVEGWIVENRQQVGFDSGLPGSGLVIYHYDGLLATQDNNGNGIPDWWDNSVEWSENHPFLDVECADQAGPDHTFNADDLDAQNNLGDAFDFFYQGNPSGATFDSFSRPSNIYYSGLPSPFEVRNVSASGTTMTADLIVGVQPGPNHDVWVKDCTNDDGTTPSWGNCVPGWTVFTSPDVWVDNNRDGKPDAPIGGPMGGQGCNNLLNVKVRNAGPQPVDYATVMVFDLGTVDTTAWTSPGLPFYRNAVICSTEVRALASGDSAVLCVQWLVPPSPPPPNFQFAPDVGVCVFTSSDTLEWYQDVAMSNNLAQCTGMELWAKGVAVGKSTLAGSIKDRVLETRGQYPVSSAEGLKQDPPPEPACVAVNVRNPYEEEKLIMIDAEVAIPPDWTVHFWCEPYGEILPPQPVFVGPLETIPLEITVDPGPYGTHGEEGWLSVTQYLADLYPDPAGLLAGASFPIEIDVYEPMPVSWVSAEVIEQAPCLPPVGWVLLRWEPVVYDVSGLLENTVHYYVYRGTNPDDMIIPENLIGVVVSDANIETEEWEWYDYGTVPSPEGIDCYYAVVAVDEAGNLAEPSLAMEFHTAGDYADLETESVRVTLTDQGIVGYMEAGGRGSGFQYPIGEPSMLYVGGLWVGTDPEHVANCDYLHEPVKEWVPTPEGHVSHVWPPDWMPLLTGPEEVICTGFFDGNSPEPQNWFVRQGGLAWPEPPDDDYVILVYEIRNQTPEPMGGLYAGLFMDWDIGDPEASGPWNNMGTVDPELQLAYMWWDGHLTCVGVRLLAATHPANISFIDNEEYVYPNAYIPDEEKFLFLSGADPAHQVTVADTPADWSMVLSAGPYDLSPDGAFHVVFAVVAGDNPVDLLVNSEEAMARYRSLTDVAEEESFIPSPTTLTVHSNIPNPFNPSTTIHYYLPESGKVRAEVYNVLGQRVATLVDGYQDAGEKYIPWDAETLPSGIYLLRVQAGSEAGTRKMVLLR
jgi:M6 family metalloprotease-like protein